MQTGSHPEIGTIARPVKRGSLLFSRQLAAFPETLRYED
jgi:hypothetical protein